MRLIVSNKVILILLFSLLFYISIDDLTADIVKIFDKEEIKIEKKKGKADELIIEDSIDFILFFVTSESYSNFICFKSSYFYQKLARPPPC